MSSYGFEEHFLQSPPLNIYFAGWNTSTYDLQQNGWQLSAYQNYSRGYSIQVAFNHPDFKIRGLTEYIDRDVYSASMRSSILSANTSIPVRAYLASDFICGSVSAFDFTQFQPIDAEPRIENMRKFMSENMVFAPNLARTQELIIPEHNVDELLSMILDKQAPDREERIRKRVRQAGEIVDFNTKTKVHAQIVSIG